ncbi:peptidoglycan-binding domain-containing protein [Streptomyces sp. NPDC006267]|uniref:peptidoglycan-binding domain-containing protein n=1 Tax=Streptomyces sp. NPDC006267 TaxID=3157173 RepID=UPI0033BA09ED
MPCRCGTGARSAQLTEEEQRAARAAEIAAAEDFDPLRIRPYVTLTDQAGASAEGGPRPGAGEAPASGTGPPEPGLAGTAAAGPGGPAEAARTTGTGGTAEAAGAAGTRGIAGTAATAETAAVPVGEAAETTMPLFLGGGPPDAGVRTEGGADTDAGAPPGGTTYPATHSASDAGRRAQPAADGLEPTPGGSRRRTSGASPVFTPDPVQPRRRRPFGALAAGAAVAVVVGTAAFAGGLLGGGDSEDEALPEATTSVADTEDEPAASVAPSPSASPSASRAPTPSATRPSSPSASASPKKSREPSPTATASASPTTSAPSAPDSGGPAPTPSPPAPPAELADPTLRPGDRGPEVAELQKRLRGVGRWLYPGPLDAHYNDQVRNAVALYQSYKAIGGDPVGVYGPETRSVLEAEPNGREHR